MKIGVRDKNEGNLHYIFVKNCFLFLFYLSSFVLTTLISPF